MSQFVTGNPDVCFFEQNPELQYITEFKNLIDSKGKLIAGKILWSIYMIEDPKSKIFRMSREEKIKEITENYYSEYDEKKHKNISILYASICLEKEERLYNIHAEKLDELTTYIETLDLQVETEFSRYIRIMDKLPKIWDGLGRVKKTMIERMNKSSIRGGARPSARESR